MGKSEDTSTTLKRSWFAELKAEFKKIVWPDRKLLGKQAVAVLAIALLIGVIIAAIDWLLQIGLNFIIG